MKLKQKKISHLESELAMKQQEITSKRTKFLLKVATVTFALASLLFFIPQKPIHSSSAAGLQNVVALPKQEVAVVIGLPLRLVIPKIKVNSAIEYVGLTSKGAVGVPKGPSKTAWYNKSARPGNIGSAVLTGHYGPWIDGRKSVFDNLYKLSKGDKIYIKDDKGVTITFIVRELKSYDKNARVTEAFFLNDSKSHLNLITCGGIWNKLSRQYSKRLVVFADKE
jgi:LPXTG-site transpeptidase (sortase) family protein